MENIRKGAEKFKKFMKIPYTLKLMGTILPFMFNRYSGYGWKYQWHKDKTTNDYFSLNVLNAFIQFSLKNMVSANLAQYAVIRM